MKKTTLVANILLLTALLGYGVYNRMQKRDPDPMVPVTRDGAIDPEKSPTADRSEGEVKPAERPATSPENLAEGTTTDVPVDIAAFKNWETHLSRFMSERGFNENEIGAISRVLGEKLKAENVDDEQIGAAIQEVARDLKFDKDREDLLASSVYFALAESTGTISFHEWETCLLQKLGELQANDCLRGIAQNLTQQVKSQIEGDAITLSQTQSLSSLQNDAVDKAVQECNVELDVAGPLLSFSAGPCR